MKFIAIFLFLFIYNLDLHFTESATTTARPQIGGNYNPNELNYARAVKENFNSGPDSYHFDFETDNGLKRDETAEINENGITVVRGFYEYIGDDGQTYRVDYIADENGYQPSGAHLVN